MRPSRRRYRPLVAAIAVLSLSSIGLATPAAGAVATGSSPATASVPAAASPSTVPAAADPLVAAAIAKAKAAGKQVLVDQDARSQRLANPDGTLTSVVSPVPVRYQDGAGAWHGIDLTLAGQLDGSVAARAAVPGPHLAGSADGPLHIPTSAGDIIAVHPGASKATAVLSANRADYSRGLGSRDLSESVLVHGVEEGVVLHSAADPASYTVTFTLPVGVTAKSVPNYGVAFDDAAGKQLLAYGGGFTHDANPSTSYPDGAQTDTVTTLVGQSGTTATVNISFDPGWLADPARVFPVTIDPSYYTNTSSTGDGQDSWVESDSSTSQYASSQLRVGYGFGVGGTAVARTLIEFQIAGLANSNNYVTEAHMQINQFASTQCATTYVNGLGAGFSNSTIWSNQPPRDGKPLVSATNLCNGWSSVDLTSVARRWFDNSAPDWGIQMQSNEQSSFGWRKFYSGENGSGYAPAIYVTYDVLPDAPDHLTPAAGTTDTTLTPTLTATAHQSSGNTARLDFQVLPYAGGTAVASGSASNVANGGTGSYTVPAGTLQDGQRYTWQVRGYDGVGYGPWSAWSDFRIDLPTQFLGACAAAPLLATRAGKWFCTSSAALSSPAVSPRMTAAGQGSTAYCDVSSVCRTNYSATSSDVSAIGSFGYGSQDLGETKLYSQYTLNGYQLTARPVQFTYNPHSGPSSVSENFEAQQYISKGPNQDGNPIDNSYSGPVGPNQANAGSVISWQPNGYTYYDTSQSSYYTVNGWDWQVAGYPGSWFADLTSFIYYCDSSGFCTYSTDLAGHPEGGTHRS